MFATIGNTMQLLRISWRVLQRDKELAFYPVLSGLGILFVFGYMAFAFYDVGAFDRLANHGHPGTIDYVLMFVAYLSVSFVIIYFNAALVAAAHQRLNGEDPDVWSGIREANSHIDAIFGWSIIAATVAFFLRQIVDNRGILGRVIGALLATVWAYMTFFVVPLLVIEGVGPIDALSRSTELFTKTWGKQLVANFGFGIAYFGLMIVALLPGLFLWLTAQTAVAVAVGVAWGVPIFLIGTAVLKAMEGIFTVALYGYASGGGTSGDFPPEMLRGAYVDKEDRGRWDNPFRYPSEPATTNLGSESDVA